MIGLAMKNHSATNEDVKRKLQRVVKDLADGIAWNWCNMASHRAAADACLTLMANEGLIEHRYHPMGGNVWRVNGKLYGRTDKITLKEFNKLKKDRWG